MQHTIYKGFRRFLPHNILQHFATNLRLCNKRAMAATRIRVCCKIIPFYMSVFQQYRNKFSLLRLLLLKMCLVRERLLFLSASQNPFAHSI